MEVHHGRIKRLVINMPPRHGKSEYVSRTFAPWELLQLPKERIFLASYDTSFATNELSMPALAFYKRFRKTNDLVVDQQHYWKTSKGGYINALGFGGAITGKGANLIFIDDPVKNDEEALNKTILDKIYRFFKTTLYTRLEPGGAIIMIATRWGIYDLTGRIIGDNESIDYFDYIKDPSTVQKNPLIWVHLKLPAINSNGEALWPERYPIEVLNSIRHDGNLGNYWFSALYQQEPIASEYQIYNPVNWNRYDFTKKPVCQYVINVMDTAFETGKENDYSVCATWGIKDNDIYLLNLWRRKVHFPDLVRETIRLHEQFKPNFLLVEKAGSGRDLVPTLKTQTKIRNIKEIDVMNKVVRAHSVQALIEQGKVFIPDNAPWIADFINEHAEFPNGKHDDIVDTTGFALQHLGPMVVKRNLILSGSSKIRKKDKLIYY